MMTRPPRSNRPDPPCPYTTLFRAFILPVGVIIGLLFAGYSPEFCAFWGTVSAAVLSWRHKATRMGPSDVLKGLVGGAQSNTSAGAAIGTLGVIERKSPRLNSSH